MNKNVKQVRDNHLKPTKFPKVTSQLSDISIKFSKTQNFSVNSIMLLCVFAMNFNKFVNCYSINQLNLNSILSNQYRFVLIGVQLFRGRHGVIFFVIIQILIKLIFFK